MIRVMVFLSLLLFFPPIVYAQAGPIPKPLLDLASPTAAGQVTTDGGIGKQVHTAFKNGALLITMKAGDADYPGITIKPEDGKPWDLGLYGHVEAKITNTGTKNVRLNLRVDNAAVAGKVPWNSEGKSIEPGQTRTLRVYFGFSHGFKPAVKINPQAATQLLFFTEKLNDDVSLRIERVQGAGAVGDKVRIDPDRVAKKPANGVILDANTVIQPAQLTLAPGAKSSLGAQGRQLFQMEFTGAKNESVTFRPAEGLWNLNEHVEVKVRVKNIGQTPITPLARVDSEAGPTDLVTASAPLAPGAQTELVIPFAAKIPWKGAVDPAQLDINGKAKWQGQPGTGTNYRSNVTTGITFLAEQPGVLLVSSIIADCPPLKLPDWLGKRPPVDGEWTQTLNEDFDGKAIDPKRWNVHPAANWWDKRMHFSKDQILVGEGFLKLRLEKKPGHANDDPKGEFTDYAAGQPDTLASGPSATATSKSARNSPPPSAAGRDCG